MAKVLIELPTSAFAAHIAKKKWGVDFELKRRQHPFLYKQVVYTPVKESAAIPTQKHDALRFYCLEKWAKRAAPFYTSIGAELHEHFISEMNTYLKGRYDTEETIKNAVYAYMDQWDFSDEIFDVESIKKSFYRYRKTLRDYSLNCHSSVTITEKPIIFTITGAIENTVMEIKKRGAIAPLVFKFEFIKNLIVESFDIREVELYKRNPRLQALLAKKVFCFLLHEFAQYSYTRISRLLHLSRRQVIYHVQEIKELPSFDEYEESIKLVLYG